MPKASSAASLAPLVMSHGPQRAPSPNAVVFRNLSHFYVASTPIHTGRTDKAVATVLCKCYKYMALPNFAAQCSAREQSCMAEMPATLAVLPAAAPLGGIV
jgi:hypothetical protein